jgi:antitoxin HicB
MLRYPIRYRRDDNGTFLVIAPDFPELTTFGDDRDDAMNHAADALEEAIAARIARREDVPAPSAGRNTVILPAQTEIKVLLYKTMREKGVRKSELARRLRWHMPQVDRLFDFRHASRLDQLESAFTALGTRLSFQVTRNEGKRT